MKIKEFNAFKKHILEYMTTEELAENIKHYKTLRESNGTTWGAVQTMAQFGCFAVYYSQVLEALAEIYGEDFDESRYYTKSGELRFKGGECYAWTIYKAKIAKACEMMEKKGEL